MPRLSDQQRAILLDIAARTPSHPELRGFVVWAPSRGHNYNLPIGLPGLDYTASERAVLSRSLARLDARGLVERARGYDQPRYNAGRTGAVRLTEAGRAEAERLTKENAR